MQGNHAIGTEGPAVLAGAKDGYDGVEAARARKLVHQRFKTVIR